VTGRRSRSGRCGWPAATRWQKQAKKLNRDEVRKQLKQTYENLAKREAEHKVTSRSVKGKPATHRHRRT
jgi:hypothetical protein